MTDESEFNLAILAYLGKNSGSTAKQIDSALKEYRRYPNHSSNIQRLVLRLKSLEHDGLVISKWGTPNRYYRMDRLYEMHKNHSGEHCIYYIPAIDGLYLSSCAICDRRPILDGDRKCLICHHTVFDKGEFYEGQIKAWNEEQDRLLRERGL